MYNYEEEYLDSLSSSDDLPKIKEEEEEYEQLICACNPEYAYAFGMRTL